MLRGSQLGPSEYNLFLEANKKLFDFLEPAASQHFCLIYWIERSPQESIICLIYAFIYILSNMSVWRQGAQITIHGKGKLRKHTILSFTQKQYDVLLFDHSQNVSHIYTNRSTPLSVFLVYPPFFPERWFSSMLLLFLNDLQRVVDPISACCRAIRSGGMGRIPVKLSLFFLLSSCYHCPAGPGGLLCIPLICAFRPLCCRCSADPTSHLFCFG